MRSINADPYHEADHRKPSLGVSGPEQLIGYAFNAKTQDVTLFDPATQQVLATKPLGAVVQWLSNEQRFWDGRHVWTYDFPDDTVQAIAVDPQDGRRGAEAANRWRGTRA